MANPLNLSLNMKGMRGSKLLKKLQSDRPTRQDRIIRVNASDGYVDDSVLQEQTQLSCQILQSSKKVQEPYIIDVSELMKDLEDEEEMELKFEYDDKENTCPPPPNLQVKLCSVQETEHELNGTREHSRIIEEAYQKPPIIQDIDSDSLLSFEEKCPPGGGDAVVFYSTTLRGIRKTFEDCNRVRCLVQTFRVVFLERDMSMHREFKNELRQVLDGQAVVPPKLFIKGRYIGGAEEVLRLHEQGKLRPLFKGIPTDRSVGPCEGCAGVRFVLCLYCSGSRKRASGDGLWSRCSECNENGLLICPICCWQK